MSMHVERVSARKYYGRHAIGSVVLVNGQPEFHGKPAEATRFIKRLANGQVILPMERRIVSTLIPKNVQEAAKNLISAYKVLKDDQGIADSESVSHKDYQAPTPKTQKVIPSLVKPLPYSSPEKAKPKKIEVKASMPTVRKIKW